MSEFRDMTSAMRALHNSMTSIEDCLVILIRDSSQQTKWRHDQKNQAVIDMGQWREVHTAIGTLIKGNFDIREEIRHLRDAQFDSSKELRDRVRELETGSEVTKA